MATKIKKSSPKMHLLAYDQNTKNKKCRRKFYRKKNALGLNDNNWTQSVVISKELPKLKKLKATTIKCGGRAKLFKLSTPKKRNKKKTT